MTSAKAVLNRKTSPIKKFERKRVSEKIEARKTDSMRVSEKIDVKVLSNDKSPKNNTIAPTYQMDETLIVTETLMPN